MAGLTVALKEWAIAVDALLAGELILLLRKGGIRDRGSQFQVQTDRALLFPTLEHQRPALLKSPWRDGPRLDPENHPVPSLAVDSTPIQFQGWADITHVLPLSDGDQVARLTPFHIWTPQWVTERMAWQPARPIYALLLRVYRLPQPVSLPFHPTYSGCRSWVTVQEPVEGMGSEPVLADGDYRDRVLAVLATIT
ncbi:DUF1802 family protein [Leptolyngbya sp. PCC 6406]|uniref:DUF1802 family protein n=1 Tax=Leptolyngbya sp. PCC 6406 TaxID=1173264 RepID=UPI0002AC91E7|nr:DUF1802 family protein [Leptolyngbya sp. PCC 6406]